MAAVFASWRTDPAGAGEADPGPAPEAEVAADPEAGAGLEVAVEAGLDPEAGPEAPRASRVASRDQRALDPSPGQSPGQDQKASLNPDQDQNLNLNQSPEANHDHRHPTIMLKITKITTPQKWTIKTIRRGLL